MLNNSLYLKNLGISRVVVMNFLMALIVVFPSCSLEEQGSSTLRAHVDVIEGIPHAFSSHAAPRYCKHCHGDGLQGGANGEPSCYQCHGERWDPVDPLTNRGDASHTVEHNGYFHHTGLATPTSQCISCHGNDLTGAGTRDGNPSCLLCHESKW